MRRPASSGFGREAERATVRPRKGVRMIVREATERDVPATLAIYNEIIRNSTASYMLEPVTLEERLA